MNSNKITGIEMAVIGFNHAKKGCEKELKAGDPHKKAYEAGVRKWYQRFSNKIDAMDYQPLNEGEMEYEVKRPTPLKAQKFTMEHLAKILDGGAI